MAGPAASGLLAGRAYVADVLAHGGRLPAAAVQSGSVNDYTAQAVVGPLAAVLALAVA